jgi:DNA-binding MarR family transcriptional regulator
MRHVAQPNDAQLDALRSILRARTSLTERLEAALRNDDMPPLGWYDVLCALDEAGEQGMRPRDLAFAVALTASGVTRLLDRMVDAGLVERKPCATDRRGYGVVLTPAGKRTHERMRPVYLREVQAAFASLVTTDEARMLSELLDRVSTSACTVIGEEPPAPTPRAA